MVGPVEAAQLSNHVYDLSKPVPEGFKFVRECVPHDFGERGAVYNNFMRAAVYEKNGEQVVAFRGSDNPANWINHDLPFLVGRVSQRYRQFAEEVARDVGLNTTFVGHSAGAPMAIYASSFKNGHAIGFDSPNIGNLGLGHDAWGRVTLIQANSIVSGYHFPSTAKIFNLPNNGNPIAAHSMVRILEKLGVSVPDDGYPFNSRSFFASFGLDVNHVSPQAREAVERPMANILKLLDGDYQQQNLPQIVMMAKGMYTQLGVVGANDRHLVRISQIGSGLIDLGTNLGALDIRIPGLGAFAGVSSIFNPVVGIATAGLSLLSAFGVRRRRRNRVVQDPLAPIVAQLQQLQNSFVDHFNQILRNQALLQRQVVGQLNQVLRNQEILFREMQHNFNLVLASVDRATYFMAEQFHNIDDRLARDLQVIEEKQRAVLLAPLRDFLNNTDDIIENQVGDLRPDALQVRICDTARGLFHWIIERSADPVFNGVHYINAQNGRNGERWVNEVLGSDPSQYSLLGYLGREAQNIIPGLFDAIDVNSLPNLGLWMEALDAYMALLPKITAGAYPKESQLNTIKEKANQVISFIERISQSDDLFNRLFERYRETRNAINGMIAARLNVAGHLVHNPQIRNVRDLFVLGSSEASRLDGLLLSLKSIKKLIAAYSHLGRVALSKNFSSDESLEDLQRDFVNSGAQTVPPWSDAQGFSQAPYYETIRTVAMRINNQEKIVALVRRGAGIALYEYNPSNNQWAQRSNGNFFEDGLGFVNPQYYKTFRVVVMSVNNHDQLFLIIRSETRLALRRYDPSGNQWAALADGPDWSDANHFDSAACYETFNANVVHINNQPKLIVTIRHSAGVAAQLYDPVANKWSVLPEGPPLSNAANFDQARYYKTIRTNVININGQEYLLLAVRQPDGVVGYLYNPSARGWNQSIRGPAWTGPDFNQAQSYETFQSAVVKIGGYDQWVVMIRQSDQLLVQAYNPQNQSWSALPNLPAWENEPESGDPRKVRFDVIHMNGEEKLVVMLNTARGILTASYDQHAQAWALLGDGFFGENVYTDISCFSTMAVRSIITGNHSKCCLFVRDRDGFECQEYRIQSQLSEDLSDCAVVEHNPAFSPISLMAGNVLVQVDELELSLHPAPAPGVTDFLRYTGNRFMDVLGFRHGPG